MNTQLEPAHGLSLLGELPSFTAADTQLWNWFNRSFVANTNWQGWITEACAPLLDRCAGWEVVLHRRSAVPGQDEEKVYRFKTDEISIGRGADNDLPLTPRSIAIKHCSITRQGDGYILEDLGSPLGIYLNKRKMKPNERALITDGDEFSIFPYRFSFETTAIWAPEPAVLTESAGPSACDWATFARRRQLDAWGFTVQVYPTRQKAYVETSRYFLEQILNRFLRPLGLQESAIRSVGSRTGVLEFLLLAVMERANQSLQFPFRLSLQADHGNGSAIAANEHGFELRSNIGLSQLTGSFRVFLPSVLLAAMMQVPFATKSKASLPLSWQFPLCIGSAVFGLDEVAGIETGDVVLFDNQTRLLFPGSAGRGWTVSAIDGNENRFRVDKYFERFEMNDNSNVADMTGTVPDISVLPIRLDVVVADREFTLREIQELAEGSIIEVNRTKDEPVQVKLNGRAAGDGELVEIDGRLGVRILRWRQGQ